MLCQVKKKSEDPHVTDYFPLSNIDPKKRRTTDVLNNMLWGNTSDGQRGFIHQIGDAIEQVFRPTAKRQEMLLQQIIEKLDRDNARQDLKKYNGTLH